MLFEYPANHVPFPNKGSSCQSCGFSSSHVQMWKLDLKESWALKNWYFRTVALEKTLESPLGCKEIQPVHPKGDRSWIFFRSADTEAPNEKGRLTGKRPFCWERLKTKGEEERQRTRWLHSITHSVDMNLNKLREMVDRGPGMLQVVESQRVGYGYNFATEKLQQPCSLPPYSDARNQAFYNTAFHTAPVCEWRSLLCERWITYSFKYVNN